MAADLHTHHQKARHQQPRHQHLVSLYWWEGEGEGCLPLMPGDLLQLVEDLHQDWYTALSLRTKKVGLVPKTYVRQGQDQLPVTKEAKEVIRLWGKIYKQMFILRDSKKLQSLERAISEMIWWRQQLVNDTLTQEEAKDLQKKMAERIDIVNASMDIEEVARSEEGLRLSQEDGCVSLYHAYIRAGSNRQGQLPPQSRRPETAKPSLSNHHIHAVLAEIGGATWLEDIVIYCQLYSERRNCYVSERWYVSICKNRPQAVFLDLGGYDQCLDLHLVVQIYRRGRILQQEGSKTQGTKRFSGRSLTAQVGPLYKRPLAGGVASLRHLVHAEQKVPNTGQGSVEVKLFSCEEKDFYHLHEQLVKNTSRASASQVGPSLLNFQLQVLAGEVEQVKREQPLIFKEATEVRRLGFPPVIMPGDLRNDLYLTLEKGQFERGGKPGMSGRNVEVSLAVFDANGDKIQDAVVPAAGGGPPHPAVLYHNNNPVWEETFRLQIPVEMLRSCGCHLRLEFRHCSVKEKQDPKLFGFSWLNLVPQEDIVIKDGVHELPVYKVDSQDRLHPAYYLPDRSGSDLNFEVFPKSPKEFVSVRTLLCSTKLTQNLDLMALLKWRSNPDRIPQILGRLMRTGGEELVKFLQDVLDALFAMFATEDGNSLAHSGLVFYALVHILACLQEPKFQHFQPVIDAYIQDHFAAALVYKGLLSCVKHCAEMVPTADNQDPIRTCFTTLGHVFKLIVASRLLFARATGGQNEESFRYEVHLLFNSFNKMLSYQSDQVLATQVALVTNLPAILPSLVQVMPVLDIAKLLTLTLDSLGHERSQYLQRAALGAARASLKSALWEDAKSRSLLLLPCLSLISHHLQLRREVSTCTDFLLEIVLSLHVERSRTPATNVQDETCAWWRDVTVLAQETLGPLGLAVIAEQETDDKNQLAAQAGLTAVLMGVLELLTPHHHVVLWRADCSVLGRLQTVLVELMSRPTFPCEWMSLRLALTSTIFTTIRHSGDSLLTLTFDKLLWIGYFRLAVTFITSPLVQIDLMKRQGRFFLDMEKTEELRVPMAEHMVHMWYNCPQQIQLVPSLVGPLLEVSLVPQREVRQTLLPLLFRLMETEQAHRGNFKQMETELIDKLDILINENKGDEEYLEIFNSLMLELVEGLEPACREAGHTFVTSVSHLLERLLDYRGVLQGEENRNKRMHCTLNLLKFYRDNINRQEMYIRYIYKLHSLHLAVDNHAEAAFTLLLHANILDWSTRMLHADLQFPMQQEWQRKEQLYTQIIQLFDRAKLWEFATPLCKELCDLYEKRIYDYSKLGDIHRRLSSFFLNIVTEFRPEPEYFRVGFYGLSFPSFIRNKEFIYRGQEYEKIAEFTQRLNREFPEAKISAKLASSHQELRESQGATIQIVSVKPEAKASGDYMGPEVSDKIRDFYNVNRVSTFLFDRAYHKGEPDPSNEFKTLWIERSKMDTASEFPGILKWFEISNKEIEHIPPVEFACETLRGKNAELRKLIGEHSRDRASTISPLTMRLQGNIDAAVNGGVAKYRAAFFTEEFMYTNPQHISALERLTNLLVEQASLLQEGLQLHGELAPEAVQPLHARLLQVFSTMKGEMTQAMPAPSPRVMKLSKIVNTPLPPLPVRDDSLHLEKREEPDLLRSPSLYGKFVPMGEEDDIYCRPQEMKNSYHDVILNSQAYHDISDIILPEPSLLQDNRISSMPVKTFFKEMCSNSLAQPVFINQSPSPPSYTNHRELTAAPPLPPRGRPSLHRGRPAPPERTAEPASAEITHQPAERLTDQAVERLTSEAGCNGPPTLPLRRSVPPLGSPECAVVSSGVLSPPPLHSRTPPPLLPPPLPPKSSATKPAAEPAT